MGVSYPRMLSRLNKLSVENHFDAYKDISWDDPEFVLDSNDSRLVETSVDPFAQSSWYQSLTSPMQSKFGLYRYASCMKTGWHFENLLQRGLLALAFREENGSDTFRYVHHEVIEESQHTLMFQEYVNRSGLPVRGMARRFRFFGELTIEAIAKHDRLLFFVFVLGGEEPADFLQKSLLQAGIEHPLLERIMRIHVTEEARHLSFARHFIEANAQSASKLRKGILSIVSPLVLGTMARIMIDPASDLRNCFDMDKRTYRNTLKTEKYKLMLKGSVSRTRKLLVDLGLVGPFSKLLWRLEGIWDDPAR